MILHEVRVDVVSLDRRPVRTPAARMEHPWWKHGPNSCHTGVMQALEGQIPVDRGMRGGTAWRRHSPASISLISSISSPSMIS